MPAARPSIQVLETALADQIAAGEVVERPASVVKELLENALDAGARRIEVDVAGAGRKLIRVADDGSGMAPEDAALSVLRHATSKLRRFEDLSAIATLGFRGEALPSIGSVSRLRLLTRTRDTVAGTEVRVDAGQQAQVSETGCAPGTVVEVSDLFFNVPARLKFLKSTATESAHIASACVRAVLGHPEVALTLRSEGRVLRELLPARDLVERAHAVLPHEELVEIDSDEAGVRVRAALAPPERARAGSGGLHLLVNGRPVRDPALARSVLYAYGSVIPPGRYPIGVVAVEVEPERVDVNVHPQKTEVRFADARVVYDTVTRLLARGLGTSAWRGPHRAASYWDARLPVGPTADRVADAAPPAGPVGGSTPDPWGLAPEPPSDAPQDAGGDLLGSHGRFGGLRVLGQVRRMLLVCEGDDALHVIDQHAADERIRFDALRRAYRARDVTRQRLLFPERVEVSEAEAELVDAHAEDLARAGIEHTRLGPTTIAVHAVPVLLARAKPERLLRDVLDEAGRHGARAFGDAVDMALATMACHGALRAGDELSVEEASTLLRNLDSVEDFAGHCPHGRPVVLRIPLDAIERRLGR